MSASPTARRRPRVHQWFAIGGVLIVVGYEVATVLRLPILVNELLYHATTAAAAVAVFAGVWRYRPAARLGWLLLGAGAAVADVAFSGYPLGHPRAIDALYLCHFPLMAAGLVLFTRRRTHGRNSSALIDAGVVTAAAALVSAVYVIGPVNAAAPGFLASLVAVAYPVGDLLLLGTGARLLLGSGTRILALRLLAGYLVVLLGADATYPLQSLAGRYHPGGWLDLVWLVGSVLLGTAALHPSMVWLAERSPSGAPDASIRRLAVLAGAVLLAPLVMVVQYLRGADPHPLLLAAGCAVLFLLVVGRLHGMARAQRYAAVTDGLTGLRTRRFFEEVLAVEAARAARNNEPLSLVLMDVDHFKRVNDAHGHLAGDRVLAEVARRLRTSVRAGDVVARYGGEEFAVLLPRTDPAIAYGVAERLRATIGSRAFAITENTAIPVTASVGLAAIPRHAANPAELLLTADRLLYEGRSRGRNRVSTGVLHVSTP